MGAVRVDRAHRFRTVHGASASQGQDQVAPLIREDARPRHDHRCRGIRPDIGEHSVVKVLLFETLKDGFQPARFDDSGIRGDENPAAAEIPGVLTREGEGPSPEEYFRGDELSQGKTAHTLIPFCHNKGGGVFPRLYFITKME